MLPDEIRDGGGNGQDALQTQEYFRRIDHEPAIPELPEHHHPLVQFAAVSGSSNEATPANRFLLFGCIRLIHRDRGRSRGFSDLITKKLSKRPYRAGCQLPWAPESAEAISMPCRSGVPVASSYLAATGAGEGVDVTQPSAARSISFEYMLSSLELP